MRVWAMLGWPEIGRQVENDEIAKGIIKFPPHSTRYCLEARPGPLEAKATLGAEVYARSMTSLCAEF
jgi:hypothetical protein